MYVLTGVLPEPVTGVNKQFSTASGENQAAVFAGLRVIPRHAFRPDEQNFNDRNMTRGIRIPTF